MSGHERFVQYCVDHGIDPKECSAVVPRFIRINPKNPPTDADLRLHLGPSLRPVPWLPKGIYSLDSTVKIHSSVLYSKAQIYGIDAASIAAVLALAPAKGDQILDLCCAPGGKTALIADILWMHDRLAPDVLSHSVVTGVDVNAARLQIARSVVKVHPSGKTVYANTLVPVPLIFQNLGSMHVIRHHGLLKHHAP